MGTAIGEKRILILCDNHKLAKALELNLQDHWPVSQWALQASPQSTYPADSFSLIILALSSPASEPVVALTRAALVQLVGLIPLLVISDRPFRASPEARITHLDFPFGSEALYNKVQEILRGDPDDATVPSP